MTASPSSSAQAAREALAVRLQHLRKDACLTGKELSARCGWHPAKTTCIQKGDAPPSDADIRAWCAACDADDQAGVLSFDRFRSDPALAALHWPDDVLEQFLFERGDNGAFVHDYGTIDLRHITWQLESIPVADFHTMQTGKPDVGCIESYVAHPVHRVAVRPPEIGRHREEHGTWLRRPLLMARRLPDPADNGLQLLEGRTRVGVLRGRAREQLHVALNHHAWVGRP